MITALLALRFVILALLVAAAALVLWAAIARRFPSAGVIPGDGE